MASETKALHEARLRMRAVFLGVTVHGCTEELAQEQLAAEQALIDAARTPPPADAGREALITALGEIATYPRPYSRTPPYHMADTIENMRAIARAALAREGETK